MKSMTKITKALFWTCLIVLLIFAVVGNVGAQQACVPPPADLVSWWPGDGDANDVRGGNNGQLMNETTFADGKIGQAFSFDGVDDHVSGTAYSLPSANSARTISAWVKAESGIQTRAILQYGTSSGSSFH